MRIKIKIGLSTNADYYGVKVGDTVEEDFERYVAAVVASEIGNTSLEASKAQAVASRTFAYRYIVKDKVVSDGSSCQVYRANRYSDSYKIAKQAAEATCGEILTYNNQPADTYFSHSNGGQTVSSKEQWGGDRPYLQSKPDPWTKASGNAKSGHGVGLSQVGAIYAASIGTGYKDILSFYYTGTKVTKYVEKEEPTGMISLEKFLNGCKRNAARIKGYKLGCNGSNGLSDCIGYVMGALALEGQSWNGTHGSNYAARYRTKNLHRVSNASQLKLGELVYKHNEPGTKAWQDSFPINTYKGHSDQNDYYHVGVVTSVNPLEISHCSGGGMHYDKKLGAWDYAGECSLVNYGAAPSVGPIEDDAAASAVTGPCTAVVDVPDDTTVNIRSTMSISSKVLVRANEGTKLEVLSVQGSWARVKYSFEKTGTGYIMSKFISADSKIDVPNDTTVNVRSKASINSSKLTTLPEGNPVKVLSKSGEWSKVEYAEPKEGTGYVMVKYLKKG